jgi:parallel beta-helix repeat protein
VFAPFVAEHNKVVSVGRRVKDVSVTGFQVRGFSGENIAVVGAQNARISRNTLIDGEQYGFLTVGSKNTTVTGNSVSSTTVRFIAICMDNVSGARVTANHISGYIYGLCVQTPGADVRDNVVKDSCIGVFVDPFMVGAKIRDNRISASNSQCPSISPFGAIGIIVDGAVNTVVRHNRIEGQTLGGAPGKFGLGIAVVDDPSTTPVAIASGNLITRNTMRNNDLDLFVGTVGTGNLIKRNNCTSSFPEGLCTGK